MATINSEDRLSKRLARMLTLILIVGVEATWLAVIVAGAVWLLFLR